MTDGGAGGGLPHGFDPGPVDGPSDEALLRQFLAGDSRAFDALVNRYERRVYAICYRYFRDPTDAEDAMQEAFVALLRRGSTFTGASSFSTWMYRVTTNACNDLARKRARRPQRDDTDVATLSDRAGSVADVEEQLAATSLGPELVAALRTLDSEHREAIVLHDVYGVGYAEIAERSGVAVGTVKSRIHRGHARLATALAAGDDRSTSRVQPPEPPTRPAPARPTPARPPPGPREPSPPSAPPTS